MAEEQVRVWKIAERLLWGYGVLQSYGVMTCGHCGHCLGGGGDRLVDAGGVSCPAGSHGRCLSGGGGGGESCY